MEDVIKKVVAEDEKGHGIDKSERRWENAEFRDGSEAANEETEQQKRH